MPKLPAIAHDALGVRLPSLPPGAAPVYAWRAQTGVVFSYWGKQTFTVAARAAFPDDAASPDGCWSLEIRSAVGTPVLPIGIERRYQNAEGKWEAVLVPEIDFDKVPDGLYAILIPGIKRNEGRIVSVTPTAVITEVRGHLLKPFRYPIPLVPVKEDPLTPPPPPPPPRPAGTPIPASTGV